jgi:hypothetical protein
MANSILIIGDSGSGKSTSGRNLNPKETFWINVANKPLPFKGWKKQYLKIDKDNPKGNLSYVSKPEGIIKALKYVDEKRPEIKTVLVDDWQYMSAFEYFDRSNEKGYDKFTDISTNLVKVAKVPASLRDDLTVVFLTHSEESIDINGKRKTKAKTIGKMVDNALTLEGLFSIVLYAKANKEPDGTLNYVFETKTNGSNTCKSPMGMFEESEIPNDLKLVKEAIIKYEQ